MRLALAFAAGLLSAALFAAPDRPTRGLLGHWDFSQVMAGISPDASPEARDAELHGPTQVDGPFGRALALAGGGTSAVLPEISSLDGSDELTISCWVLWQDTGQYPNILTGGAWSPGGFMIFVSNDTCSFRMGRPGHKAGRAGDEWRETSAPLVNRIERGRWYHLAATFQRPRIVTYVDGEPVGGANWDYPVGHEGDMRLGAWAGKESHRGLIDELKIHGQALGAAEIRAEFEATSAGRNPGGFSPAWQPVEGDDAQVPTVATYRTEASELAVDALGRVVSLRSLPDGRELIRTPLPLVTAQMDGRRLLGGRCQRDGDDLVIDLRRNAGQVVLRITPRPGYFRLAVVRAPAAESLVFCQLAPAAASERGSMLGMLSDDTHGVCLRALNLDTNVTLASGGTALAATSYGKHGIERGDVALVAAPRGELRQVLKRVTETEDVPKSELGGAWAMESEDNRGSYLFSEISEANADEWIELARRGGFTHIHFHGWWSSLGHYEPNKSRFPDGLESMKRVVDRIHAAGLKASMHTLTGCISTNDPWVTPVPDPRLAADASYTLARALGPEDKEIFLTEPFGNHDVVWSYSGNGNVVRIGEELIHYEEISREEPYALRRCIRGAFKTRPAAHAAGAQADHLLQRYLAFYPEQNSTLVDELADCVAKVFNTVGMDGIYFDGSEGMGDWRAIVVMRHAIFRRLERPALTEASCWGHHNWWFHSRLGAWDHASWAPKQFADMHIASAETHRFQDLLEPQLGWWALIGPSAISRGMYPEEVEYFIGKTLSINAPMSMQGVNVGARPPNARQNEYFTLLGWYENLRLARYFTPETAARLREPGHEFRLRQSPDGIWQFHSLATAKHRVDGAPGEWTVRNSHAGQPLRLRVESLYAVEAYDSPQVALVSDFADLDGFKLRRHAPGVAMEASLDTARVQTGAHSLRLVASNQDTEPRVAWAEFGTHFQPYLSINPGQALGFWVYGDGKGAVLNIQLQNPREHTHCFAEHYVDLDFVGWKYVEIPFRERSSERYHGFSWPYYSQHGIFRNRLQPNVVSALTLYLTNLPENGQAEVLVSPIRALPIRSVPLTGIALAVNGGAPLALPDLASSGGYLEVDEGGVGTVRDPRGEIVDTFTLPANWPLLKAGDNSFALSASTTEGYRARAEVTVFSLGEPAGERNPSDRVDWSRLAREYVRPRTLAGSEPAVWEVHVRPEAASAGLEVDLELSGNLGIPEWHDRPGNVVVEGCDDPAGFELSAVNQYSRYAYDSSTQGVPAKPGVSHELAVETAVSKTGRALRYTATSQRGDNGGWAAKGRRFDPPLDASGAKGLGFWLHGDGKGETFKVQLRDVEGKWHDMNTRVDFTGWRYIAFAWERLQLDPRRIEYLIFYYNSIPGGATVACVVDDVRVLHSTVRIAGPVLEVNGTRVALPVEMGSGDRLFVTPAACVVRSPGEERRVALPVALPELKPGRNQVRLLLDLPAGATAQASLVKTYR
ncbi:MAG: LamG-like jellyroll fold domain-containing protein [Lentisphaeria bacterium]|jgi:hypothetical protein|nr:LamG-like jellyroll fold domain-containing protein [Lentisphaeria bacterium]